MLKFFSPRLYRRSGLLLLAVFSIICVCVSISSSRDTFQEEDPEGVVVFILDRESMVGNHKDAEAFAVLDCIQCHGTRYDEHAPHADNVLTAHAANLQFAYPPPDGVESITNDTCRLCHRSVDLIEESAINIRKQVSLEAPISYGVPNLDGFSCVQCHALYYRAAEYVGVTSEEVLDHILGKSILRIQQQEVADVNYDGEVNIADLIILALQGR